MKWFTLFLRLIFNFLKLCHTRPLTQSLRYKAYLFWWCGPPYPPCVAGRAWRAPRRAGRPCAGSGSRVPAATCARPGSPPALSTGQPWPGRTGRSSRCSARLPSAGYQSCCRVSPTRSPVGRGHATYSAGSIVSRQVWHTGTDGGGVAARGKTAD